VKRLAAVLLLAAGCASVAPPAPTPGGPAGTGPFAAAPAAAHAIRVSVDVKAAREILASLSRQRFEPSDVKVIEDMLPVRLVIQDSGRPDLVFQRDFAAAWDPESKTAVFDFASIRRERERWEVLLTAVESGRAELERESARRAATLLPGDRTVSVSVAAYVTFGISGLADHMVAASPDGTPAIIIDLARALGETEPSASTNQISRLVRLLSGEAYRQAWARYREGSPAWGRPLPRLGPVEPLVRTVGESGPVAMFGLEESFFPLATWLKEPMQRSINDLSRMGERLIDSEKDLEARVSLSAEIKRGDFVRRVAAPAGAYMADGILETFGIDALRSALSSGPLALFTEYERAGRTNKDLPPFSKPFAERLAAAAGEK